MSEAGGAQQAQHPQQPGQQQQQQQQQSQPSSATAHQQESPYGPDSAEGCPLCRFIEAGACGEQHKVWVACRGEAKAAGADFVQACAGQFRAFFSCMLRHEDYYAPFLEAFHVDRDRSRQAIDEAEAAGGSEQQQPAPPPRRAGRSGTGAEPVAGVGAAATAS